MAWPAFVTQAGPFNSIAMGRPIAVECVHGGCEVIEDFNIAPSGVFFDIQTLFEGKQLQNAQTEVRKRCNL